MPLPASIRSLKAQLRTLSDPDFWSSVLGIVLLMPLGWQIFNHLQQPTPQAQTPEPTSELDVTKSIKVESPTANSSTAADIENSAVLEQLLAGGVQSQPSVPTVLTPPVETTTDTIDLEGVAPSNSTPNTQAILERYSSASSPSATTRQPVNSDLRAIAYAARASTDGVLNSPANVVNPNPTPSSLQAAMDRAAQPQPIESSSEPPLMDVKQVALSEPPLPPLPSTSEGQTAYPLPNSAPATALRSLPVLPLPTSSVEESGVVPTPNTLPPSLNGTPTPTQQTKLYPYIPERVYSSPLPALPPSPTGMGWNGNGLPPLPNSGITPQSLNPPIDSTQAQTNPPTVDNSVQLQPVSLPVERSIGATGIQAMPPAIERSATQSKVELQPLPLPVERSIGDNGIQPIQPVGNSSVQLHPTPNGVERLLGGGEINTFANP